MVILCLHCGHQKCYDPLFFFSFFEKIYDPQYIWDPIPDENDSPKLNIFRTKLKFCKQIHIFSSRSSIFSNLSLMFENFAKF